MDSTLQELFTHIITDHYKHPRNRRAVDHPTLVLRGENPLCGDQVSLAFVINDGKIADIGFQSQGCALSTASASILTTTLKGRRLAEVSPIYEEVVGLARGEKAADEVSELAALSLAAGNPGRIACVMLAWDLVKSLE